jgi:DNA-binding CsgD family transcriptional regulator
MQVPTSAAVISHHRDALIERAGKAGSVRELFDAVSKRLRRLVPFDAAVWLATDPATNLPTAPTRSESMDHIGGIDQCFRQWEQEFQVEDVNLYRDLALADTPAAGLRSATRDSPRRSPRYRDFVRPHGFDDELRAVLRAGGEPWASVCLLREPGRPAFDATEASLVASLSEPLGEAIRVHARAGDQPPAVTSDPGPGLMVFAPDGELVAINDDAVAWLDELSGGASPRDGVGRPEPFSVPLPMVVAATVMRAQAVADERDRRPARARVRSLTGRWLVCHASCMRGENGEFGNTALVLEPATASEIAPIIVQAYELSSREQEITQLIAKGMSTAAIAERLHLSAHTVRDYVKAVLEKVGVSNRGELVAKLFAEHYAPVHFEPGALNTAELPS